LDLFYKNLEILKNNNINFGTCLIAGINKSEWEDKKNILKKIRSMGGFTQIDQIIIRTKKHFSKDFYNYFHDYMYKCFILEYFYFKTGNKITKFDYNDFEKFEKGIQGNKLCFVKQLNIDPFLNVYPECGFFNNQSLSLLENNILKIFNNFKTIQCSYDCLSKGNLINKKLIKGELND